MNSHVRSGRSDSQSMDSAAVGSQAGTKSKDVRMRRDEELASRRASIEREFVIVSLGYWAVLCCVLATALYFSTRALPSVIAPAVSWSVLGVVGVAAWCLFLSGKSPAQVLSALIVELRGRRRRP